MKLYNLTAQELAKRMIESVYKTTGITATAGIGHNLFLAKVALDISAKHASDFIGVLDEESFKETIWHHTPITDIWSISRGTANRLLKYNVRDLYGVTQLDEELLFKEFGVNARLLIDHAYGIEPCTIADIKAYKSKNNSISNNQILFSDYNYDDALLAVKEMVDLQSLELVEKGVVTSGIGLSVGYSKDVQPASTASRKLDGFTQSREKLMDAFVKLYKEIVLRNYPIRRIAIALLNVKDESYESFDLFSDEEKNEKEKNLQKTILDIKNKYGKNSILKGMNLEDNATTIKRNKLIGGHNSGEEE